MRGAGWDVCLFPRPNSTHSSNLPILSNNYTLAIASAYTKAESPVYTVCTKTLSKTEKPVVMTVQLE